MNNARKNRLFLAAGIAAGTGLLVWMFVGFIMTADFSSWAYWAFVFFFAFKAGLVGASAWQWFYQRVRYPRLWHLLLSMGAILFFITAAQFLLVWAFFGEWPTPDHPEEAFVIYYLFLLPNGVTAFLISVSFFILAKQRHSS